MEKDLIKTYDLKSENLDKNIETLKKIVTLRKNCEKILKEIKGGVNNQCSQLKRIVEK